MTTVLVASNGGGGKVSLACYGQSTGTIDQVRHELANLTRVAPATPLLTPTSRQSGAKPPSGWPYETVTQKAKSDYVASPMSEAGIKTLLSEILKPPSVAAICDAYGGAVGTIADDASAFAHRKMLYSIQYFINWNESGNGMTQTKRIGDLYAAMRPYASGTAYVNYPDLDLPDYATAYWGANLPRLKRIKSAVDPDNVFHHAQSVPLP
jgi:FAD/FMN-containing dehydrogenase